MASEKANMRVVPPPPKKMRNPQNLKKIGVIQGGI